MSANSHIIRSFGSFKKAVKAIREVKSTGRDISSLSLVGTDWRTHARTAANSTKGDMIEIGSIDVLISDNQPLTMRSAFFYCADLGGVVMAGPMSKWALNLFTGDETRDDGLDALHEGLVDLGVSEVDIEACQAAIRQGRVLIIIPGDPGEDKRRPRRSTEVIRISDASKYG